MRCNPLYKIFILFLALALPACSGSGESVSLGGTEVSATDSALGNAMASGINEVNQAMQLSDIGLSPASGVVFKNFKKKFSLIPSAYAALGDGGCLDSDPNVTITFSCDDTTHIATILRDFGEGCTVNEDITVTGRKWIEWTNMGSPACNNASLRRPKFWVAVQGTPPDAAQRLASTDPDSPTAPVTPIVRTFSNGEFVNVIGYHTIHYSGYQMDGETQSVNGNLNAPNVSRIRYQSDGVTKIFDHTISTPTALNFTQELTAEMAPIQTVHSGEVAVSHNIAQFTVKDSFNEMKYDYNLCECFPVSGSVGITVTDNNTSEQLGSGTITFTYNETGECGSATVTYEGRPIRLPTLERCR